MCRLLGLRTSRPVPLYRYLIGGDNSFAVQSLEHPDGWGLAYFRDERPTVVKSILPAICDELFEKTSFEVEAETLLAHIRRATAGRVAQTNCHPFRRGSWVFAHNGHIQGIEHLRGELLDLIAPDLRDQVEGNTDSELYFSLFLTALRERVALDEPSPTVEHLRQALTWAVATIRRLADPPGAHPEPSWLTCLASNGGVMLGLCGGRPLALQQRLADGGRDSMIMFSSEAISAKGFQPALASWHELGDDEIAVVGRDLSVTTARIG
jgi:hypothetical protein